MEAITPPPVNLEEFGLTTAQIEVVDEQEMEKHLVEAKYSDGPQASYENTAIVSEEQLIAQESYLLRDDAQPEEKQKFERMVVGAIATYVKVNDAIWEQIGELVYYVQRNEIYSRASGKPDMVSWLKDVLIPGLRKNHSTGKSVGVKALQQWGRAAWAKREVIGYLNHEGLENLNGLELQKEDWRKIVSLFSDPGNTFKGMQLSGDDLDDVKETLVKEMSSAFTDITYEANPDDVELDAKARKSTRAAAIKEGTLRIGKALADKVVNDEDIIPGRYYQILDTVEWWVPPQEEGEKWEKASVTGLKDEWVEIVSYNREDQTVEVKPWNIFTIPVSDREKNHMDNEGMVQHDIPVGNLNLKAGKKALTKEEVEDTSITLGSLNGYGDITFSRREFRRIHNVHKARHRKTGIKRTIGDTISELTEEHQQLTEELNALKEQMEKLASLRN